MSTSYVKRLQEDEPPTPTSPEPSNSASHHLHDTYRTDETTPLLAPPRTPSTHHLNAPHTSHHLLPAIDTTSIEVLTNSPRIMTMRRCACGVGCACPYSDSVASIHSPTALFKGASGSSSPGQGQGLRTRSAREERIHRAEPTIGRQRQVVGLLVLQLGIMIHSIVIGLTLAIATGADFSQSLLPLCSTDIETSSASLTTAIIFHQLFEGLSLGIRIAALPPPPLGGEESETQDFSKPKAHGYHRFVNNMKRIIGGERGEGWLKCSLAVLFAITAPAGMGLGMIVFQVRKKKEGIELGKVKQMLRAGPHVIRFQLGCTSLKDSCLRYQLECSSTFPLWR